MAIIKCKMCGGELDFTEGAGTAKCEYCDTVQTIPNLDDEKKLIQFERAERLRKQCEFDKAAGIYETIVADFREESEAYWGLVLCKYGIEYVDDPGTGKKVPTCHRSSFDSIMDDPDLEQALENAGPDARRLYREEAKAIEEIRKGIISVSSTEKPYDIFICYKETDPRGDRTLDSVLAQEIYDKLTDKGYRVFFSRITLEDKLGLEYEPYIFAALNSAKVMLAFGTDYEYFNAVWVKNEWSRFLKLMAKDKEKHLIPCFKGIDAYDMPKEFARLQSQDLGKVGADQDLLRGIEKLLPRQTETAPAPTVVTGNAGTDGLLRKAEAFLENKKWKSVQDTCRLIAELDPTEPWGYIYQLARVMRVTNVEDLGKSVQVISESKFYSKALKYAPPELQARLENWLAGSQAAAKAAEVRCAPGREKAEKVRGLVAAGEEHTVAVRADGCVLAAGENNFGQCNTGSWKNIRMVACGAHHTVGIRADGTVIACGNNEKGQCQVSSWTNICTIACGDDFTVGLKNDGTVVACGNNENNQCSVENWTDVQYISCGYHHTIGQKADGTVLSTGSDKYGQCNLSGWDRSVQIKARNTQSLGLRKNGTVQSAGNTEDDRISVKNWRNIVDIAMGTHHALGLQADGTVKACGDDGSNRCSGTRQWTNIAGVACGFWHSVAVREDGTVLVSSNSSKTKCNVAGWKLFESIDTLEEERSRLQVQQAEQDNKFRHTQSVWQQRQKIAQAVVAMGQEHILTVHTTGRVLAQGNNSHGQCNVGNWNTVIAVACGEFFSLGLREDGTVIACGKNDHGQCNVATWRDITAIACGYDHAVGLREDGTVIASGNNELGCCDVTDWQDVIAVACGYHHTLGLKKDGTVLVCGSDRYGQCNVASWQNVTAIAAHNVQSVGLRADGTVLFCGDTTENRGAVEGWQNICAISCGTHHTVGLRDDGTVLACGYDAGGRCSGTRGWSSLGGIVCGYWCTVGVSQQGDLLLCGELENTDLSKMHPFTNIDKVLDTRTKYAKNRVLLPILCRNWQKTFSFSCGCGLNENRKPVFFNAYGDTISGIGKYNDLVALGGNFAFIAGLRKNGTVVCGGDLDGGAAAMECWEDIIQLQDGDPFQLGLRQDGTVVTFGLREDYAQEIAGWRGIQKLYAGGSQIAGLRRDGTVAASGDAKHETDNWTHITDIACGNHGVMGLRQDGRALIASDFMGTEDEQVAQWTDVVQLSMGNDHVAGLRKDGTVLACGSNHKNQCGVASWRDVVAIACGKDITLGLTNYGMVFACGEAEAVRQVNGLTNVGAITSDGYRVYVLRSDGTVLFYTGSTFHSKQAYTSLAFLGDPEEVAIPTDPEERRNIHNKILEKKQAWRNAGVCQHCGGELKGLFTKTCVNCGKTKDY